MSRVLVVDDDPLILPALTRILESEGYEVKTHRDPVQAALETDFAVVITDFMMPEMNGIELLGKLKASNPRAVRMLLTAAGDYRVASEAVNRGEVFRLLSKPWTYGDLTSAVRQAFEHYRLVEENDRLNHELSRANGELRQVNKHLEARVVERTNGLLEGLVSALDYRDTETQWHSRRVALFARTIAEASGVTGTELEVVEQGALLHDIGKIGVRDSILLKPGPLTPEEWKEMKLHPELGYWMLAKMPYLHDISLIVLQHQERFDGKGYPQGLKGDAVVLGARIFAIADTLDAITSDRPYRKGRSIEVAREEIKRCSGTQFDPRLVDTFLAIPDQTWLDIRTRVEGMEAEDVERWESSDLRPPTPMRRDELPARVAVP